MQALPNSFLLRREPEWGPNGEFDLYKALSVYLTDPKREAIKTSLADVDVDADTVTVSRKGKEFSLYDGVPLLAWHCERAILLRKIVPTSKDVADEQDAVLKLCHELSAALDDCSYNSLSPDPNSSNPPASLMRFPELADPAWRLEAALHAFTAELQRCLNVMATSGSGRGRANATAHRLFWKELTHLWRANLGKDVKWGMRSNRLASFIIACSRPFFPEETTDKAVGHFVEDCVLSGE